jgi:hypothetical protein
MIVLGEMHLRRIVSLYARYYNEARTHLSLAKDAPITRPIECFGRIIAEPMVRCRPVNDFVTSPWLPSNFNECAAPGA